MTATVVSIVVCTHNRAGMLRDALESLTRIETRGRFRYEIVVVDNASTDATAEVVAQVQRQTQADIHYAYEGKKGIASARNRGLREAQGEWIAFFDDDQLADPSWLAELYAFAHDGNLLAVGGAVYLKLPEGCQRELHPFVRMLLGEARHSSQPLAYSPKINPGTGNLMLHRSVFTKVGTFNEAFAARAEDTELYCRMWAAGIEAWYVPTAIVHHVTPHDRLQTPYLNRLASFMGDGIAQRERAARSVPAFLVRWAAKSTLLPLLLTLRLIAAKVFSFREAELGLRCRLRLALAYARRGLALLQEDMTARFPNTKWLSHEAAKPA